MFGDDPEQVYVPVKAGSLVLADARLLHAALQGDWDAMAADERNAARFMWFTWLRMLDHAYLQHEAGLLSSQRRTTVSPHSPDSSGWNWQARTFPRSAAETNSVPYTVDAVVHAPGALMRRNELAK